MYSTGEIWTKNTFFNYFCMFSELTSKISKNIVRIHRSKQSSKWSIEFLYCPSKNTDIEMKCGVLYWIPNYMDLQKACGISVQVYRTQSVEFLHSLNVYNTLYIIFGFHYFLWVFIWIEFIYSILQPCIQCYICTLSRLSKKRRIALDLTGTMKVLWPWIRWSLFTVSMLIFQKHYIQFVSLPTAASSYSLHDCILSYATSYKSYIL